MVLIKSDNNVYCFFRGPISLVRFPNIDAPCYNRESIVLSIKVTLPHAQSYSLVWVRFAVDVGSYGF